MLRSLWIGGFLCATAGATNAAAAPQSVQPLLEELQDFADTTIYSFEDAVIRDDGDWFATSLTAQGGESLLYSFRGTSGRFTPQPILPGTVFNEFIDLNATIAAGSPCSSPNYQGILVFKNDADPGTPQVITLDNDRALYWNGQLLLREGDLSQASGVGAGTRYVELLRSVVEPSQDLLLLARMDDPLIPGIEYAVVRLDVQPACAPGTAILAGEEILLRTGDAVIGTNNRLVRLLSSEKRSFATNARGDYMALAEFSLDPIDRRVVLNGRGILTEYQPLPDALGNVIAVIASSVDLNDLGDFVIQTKTTAPSHTGPGVAIIKGHAGAPLQERVFVQTFQPVPDPQLASQELRTIGRNGRYMGQPLVNFPTLITNSGDVIWYGEWSGGLLGGAGIFVNHKLVVHRGQFVNGREILEIGSPHNFDKSQLREELEASPNGRYVIFEAYVDDPAGAHNALFRIDLGESVPYGVRPQAHVGPGCTQPYPAAALVQESGMNVAGSLSNFPLIGKTVRWSVSQAPASTTVVVLGFSTAPAPGFPCGVTLPQYEALIGPGQIHQFQRAYFPGVPALFELTIPADPSLIGAVSYAQAFFLQGTGIVGATNGLRVVIGDD